MSPPMRPPRDDIAAPDIHPGMTWIGDEPRNMPTLTAAGPALVHFFDFAQLNSVRTLPYIAEWSRRYADAGLSVVGVQAPRFPFGADAEAVRAGLDRLGVDYPVAIDSGRNMWLDYGCEGWPCLFLWGQGGVLRWAHFGEGEYAATEEAIQDELRELDALRALPVPMAPIRPGDGPGDTVIAPTPEVTPAGDRPWTPAEDGALLELDYEAAGAWATVEGEGTIRAGVDGEPGNDVEVPGPGIYELSSHPAHEAHSLQLDLSPGIILWTISFAPGVSG